MNSKLKLPFKFSLGAILALSILVGASAAQTYKVTIEARDELSYTGLILLTDPAVGSHYTFVSPHVKVVIAPEPSTVPKVKWSVNGGPDFFIQPQTGGFGSIKPEPDIANIDRNDMVGPFTIIARLGPPVNARVERMGFAYEQITIGCADGFFGGMSIDSRGVPHASKDTIDADIYVTGPLMDPPWDRCSSTFHDPAATYYTLHVPGGGIVVNAGPSDFPAVTRRSWSQETATSFDMRHLTGTLLWRTRDGRLVKTLDRVGSQAFIGPTIIADGDGSFADTLAADISKH